MYLYALYNLISDFKSIISHCFKTNIIRELNYELVYNKIKFDLILYFRGFESKIYDFLHSQLRDYKIKDYISINVKNHIDK